MKQLLTTLFLLAVITGYAQIGPAIPVGHLRLDSTLKTFTGATEENRGIEGLAAHFRPYDTVKVIAEVYRIAQKQKTGLMECIGDTCHDIYAWQWDSSEVRTTKVLAWEVWEMATESWSEWSKPRRIAVEKIATLAYNKKDTLSHVLQSWRVEW